MDPVKAELRRKTLVIMPLLMILFLISYGLVVVLVVLQGRTIDAQHELIYQMVNDERYMTEMLAHMTHAGQAKAASGAGTQGASKLAPAAGPAQPKAADPQVAPPPAAATRNQQTPSSQAKPQPKATTGNTRKPPRELPVRPPAQITDPSDMRRVTLSI